ncbi:MAG: ATP-dependent DNA helicase RecG, partial [Lachnospiraceae bacterium]|nr:ATP-dependent DNA helicase RecG [Lachnospiraceae bacterium]
EKLLTPFGVRITLLVGSMTAKEKREAYEKMRTQETDVIIGTHALIQEKAEYARLGLVITDEQHRFGVKQREKLAGKGEEPHILVMSATPIPRTLAMMLYGDMDISVMKELPAERLPIKNCVVGTDYRETAYKFIAKQLAEGHQAYIICPMVEESEESELENVTDYAKRLQERYGEAICVGALHGRMKADEKNSVMERFASGEIQILVSTTVVEVGVNVPNATVMMIENAERFGLAQLHQLRGRVGRGSAQSYCIIMSGNGDEQTMERLGILNKSNDGFFIASEDLRLRGPGDLFGIRQSGDMTFKIGDIYQDADCLKEANEAANRLFNGERKKIMEELGQNGANDIFLFLDAYSTI